LDAVVGILELLEVLDLDLETRDFLEFFEPSTSTSTSEFKPR
jgi:hypothetical protein